MDDRRIVEPFSDNGHQIERVGVAEWRHQALSPLSPRPGDRRSIVADECRWRLPEGLAGCQSPPNLLVTRWRGSNRQEQTSENAGDYYLLSVSLQPAKFSLRLGKVQFPNTEVVPGTIQLTQPGLSALIRYHSDYDALHLYIHSGLLKECFESSRGKPPTGDIVLRDPQFARDPLIKQLAGALLSCGDDSRTYDQLYADTISLTIVAHLLNFYTERPRSATERKIAALPPWRLKQATSYIEAHSDRNISLAELAGLVGLSRMHFAAQFRRATGLRPHEYLLGCRVQKAKLMLATSTLPIVEVALTVGFSSQSHFADVFKRFSGVTPRRWRELSRDR